MLTWDTKLKTIQFQLHLNTIPFLAIQGQAVRSKENVRARKWVS